MNSQLAEEKPQIEKIDSLAGFFDLLAKYDFEDKKKLEISSNSLVSAPKELELETNLQQ